jgi:hypothetical protein
MTTKIYEIVETDYVQGAAKLSNDELLEAYEVTAYLVEFRKGIKYPKLWKSYNDALAALEAEVNNRRGA